MKLEDAVLICTQKEYDLVKKYNWMASPWNAGLFLYNALKREGIVMEWNASYFKDIYLAFRKKNIKIIEETIYENK